MRRSNIALILLLIAPAAFAADGDEPKPSSSAPATPPAGITAAPREVAPNAGAYGLAYGPYKYDPAGNITAIGNDYYVYDPMGRLVGAGLTRPDQPGTQTQTYTYDPYGNRTSLNGAAQSASTTTNRLTSYGAVYDVAGNLQQW
jgi:YD repeat-containing protein